MYLPNSNLWHLRIDTRASIGTLSRLLYYFFFFLLLRCNFSSHVGHTTTFTNAFFTSPLSLYRKFNSNVPKFLLSEHLFSPHTSTPFPLATSCFVRQRNPTPSSHRDKSGIAYSLNSFSSYFIAIRSPSRAFFFFFSSSSSSSFSRSSSRRNAWCFFNSSKSVVKVGVSPPPLLFLFRPVVVIVSAFSSLLTVWYTRAARRKKRRRRRQKSRLLSKRGGVTNDTARNNGALK
mmetsp:Transcript_483/g.1336  ORF Transcript_483/g.1336 Transcript_483/m.1336 type:complete len:232 (-) Transcript_483:44-739(-)